MRIHELDQCFQQEGCNLSNYAIGVRGLASDAYCLVRYRGNWRVFYTERGCDHPPIFESTNEEEACEFFYSFIMRFRHDHCVGFFRSQAKTDALCEKLREHGIPFYQDTIPYGGPQDVRHRVFVVGKDIFKARDLLGELPLEDRKD